MHVNVREVISFWNQRAHPLSTRLVKRMSSLITKK